MVNIALTGKGGVNGNTLLINLQKKLQEELEASPGIEPGCKDLQSSA